LKRGLWIGIFVINAAICILVLIVAAIQGSFFGAVIAAAAALLNGVLARIDPAKLRDRRSIRG